jgi:8-amino-7-oxononanoate synthase
MPAALAEAPLSRTTIKLLAEMMGMEDGIAFASTLHLFRDAFTALASPERVFFLDDHAYPITSWGLEGIHVQDGNIMRFPHGDARSLRRLMKVTLHQGQRPVVVTDGWCPQCGRAMPLREYHQLVLPYKGLLVVDDTQALGILGAEPTPQMPYGFGGGGILPWLGLNSTNILVGASLAKGFGAPLAMLLGSAELLQKIREESLTRIHCSSPSSADFSAAQHALKVNNSKGEELRRRLYSNVCLFQRYLSESGIAYTGGIFPIQMLDGLSRETAEMLLDRLSGEDIQAILLKKHDHTAGLCFCLRADHQERELHRTTRLIAKLLGI